MSETPPILTAIKNAILLDGARISITQTFGHGLAVQVMRGSKKIGPLLFPGEGKSLADLLAVLGEVIAPAEPEDVPF